MSATDTNGNGDFLANVVDRAHGRAPVVVPRPTSLFEPVAAPIQRDPADLGGAYQSMSEPAQNEVAGPATAIAPHIRERDAMRRATSMRRETSISQSPRASEAVEEPIVASLVPTGLPLQRMSTPRENERESMHGSALIASPLVARTPMPTPNPFAPIASAILPAVATQQANGDRYASDPKADTYLRGRLDVSAAPTDARAHTNERPHAAHLLPNREAVAAIAPAVATNPVARGERTQQNSAQPVVTISIGRVEVRAAPIAAAPPTARTTSTRRPMRLDEYLDRKDQGR